MKTTGFRNMCRFLLAGTLLMCAGQLAAQNAASDLASARAAMERKDYRTAARMATKVYFLSGTPDEANEALKLSIAANAAIPDADQEKNRSAELNKTTGLLLVLTGEQTIFRCFKFQCGRDFSVPSGEFLVGPKLAYPNFELNGVLYKTGAEGNTLGSRWIELRDADGIPAAGIHGEAPLAGEDAEQLFFRMKNSDVNELFGLLKEGSRVLVR